MPLVLSGTAYEMGRQFGRSLGSRVTEFIESRLSLLCTELPHPEARDRGRVRALGEDLFGVLEQHLPDAARELDGVSAGADVPLRELVCASAYTDLFDLMAAHTGAFIDADHSPHECSAFVRRGDGVLALGQTWDMPPDTHRFIAVVERRPADGPRSLAITLVGGLSYMGLNECGLAVGTTNVASTRVRRGVIFPATVRALLTCTDVDGAADLVRTLPHSTGHFYFVADADEHVLTAEVDGQTIAVDVGCPEAESHTNHFLMPGMIDHGASLSSLTRLRALRSWSAGDSPVRRFTSLLSDHRNGLCRHSADGSHFVSLTAAGVVFEPARRRMSWTVGAPCESPWTTYTWSENA